MEEMFQKVQSSYHYPQSVVFFGDSRRLSSGEVGHVPGNNRLASTTHELVAVEVDL